MSTLNQYKESIRSIDPRTAAIGWLSAIGAVFGVASLVTLYTWFIVLVNDVLVRTGVEFGPQAAAMNQALLMYPWVGLTGYAAANAASVFGGHEYSGWRWAKAAIGAAVLVTSAYLWLLDLGVVAS